MHDGAHRQRRHLVDELPRAGVAVHLRDGVDDLAAELTDLVLGDGPLDQLAVLDDDRLADGPLELHVEVLGEQLGEDGAPGPVGVPLLLFSVCGRQFVDGGGTQQVERLRLVEPWVLVGEQIHPGDVVLNRPDDVLAEPRAEYLLLHAHEDARLRAGLLVLERVHVHLVAVEVGIVWRTII